MKKLFAILVSALLLSTLLCTMIPFATVSAEGEPTIVLEPSVTEVNAGDTFEVAVSLMDNPGVISAKVAINFDPNVFELITEWVYDEDMDEDVEMNKIDVATGWSSKYITFGPLGKCSVLFVNGTATKNVTRELFYTASFKVKDDAESGSYDLTVDAPAKDLINIDGERVAFGAQNATITVNGSEPACKHEYEYDCSKVCSLCGEESRPEAEHRYLYACDPVCQICWEETNPGADHSIIHVEANEAVSCIEYGNKEYWTCEHCHAAWLDADLHRFTSLKAVVIAGECISDSEYPCQDGVCINCGMDYIADDAHTYVNEYDASCSVCGEIRDVVAAPTTIIFNGNATSVEKSGLAFLFEMAASNVQMKDVNYYVNSSATVVLEDTEYTLVTMGAIMNNTGETELTLDMVDDKYTKNVVAERLYGCTDNALSFAVRAINIPEEYLDTEITARPYMIVEKDGAQIVLYGEVQSNSYNNANT